MPGIDIPGKIEIPIELYNRRYNKTTRLINNNSMELSVEAKKRWFEYSFEKPVYAQSVCINTEGYDKYDKIDLEYTDAFNTIHRVKMNWADGVYICNCGCVVKEFRFKPGEKYFSFKNQKIIRVSVTGYGPSEFDSLETAIFEIDDLKRRNEEENENISARKLKVDQEIKLLKEEEGNLNASINNINAKIGVSQAQLEKLQNEIATNETKRSSLESTVRDLDSSISTKAEERRDIVREISEKKQELNKIQQEIRLFPSEISGFVTEGARSVRNYMLLSAPFICIILYVTYSLYSRAADLTYVYKKVDVDVWSIFLTRIPFVIVAVTILQVCGFAVSRFIYEILQINRQRLNLSKLSIVAKDVSTASSANLDLSSDQKFELETHLKMELLREHMKQYVGEGFEYQGGRIAKFVPEWLKQKKIDKKEISKIDTEED